MRAVTMVFNVFMNRIMREVKKELQGGVQMLLFAVVVYTENKEDMERNLAVKKVAMKKWGMNIYWGKTTVLMVSRSRGACKIYVEGEEVEVSLE